MARIGTVIRIVLLAASMICIVSASESKCPETYKRASKLCWKIYQTPKTYAEAQKTCRAAGAHLFSTARRRRVVRFALKRLQPSRTKGNILVGVRCHREETGKEKCQTIHGKAVESHVYRWVEAKGDCVVLKPPYFRYGKRVSCDEKVANFVCTTVSKKSAPKRKPKAVSKKSAPKRKPQAVSKKSAPKRKPEDCTFAKSQHAGYDYRHYYQPSKLQCVKDCAKDARCKGATWTSQHKLCHFHNKLRTARVNKRKGFIFYWKNCAKELRYRWRKRSHTFVGEKDRKKRPTEACTFRNQAQNGNIIRTDTKSDTPEAQCIDRCRRDRRCAAVTWIGGESFICHTHDKVEKGKITKKKDADSLQERLQVDVNH